MSDDTMCLICGQEPVPGAPRKLGEWDDAGHTDGAHYPNWTTESFAGSWWDAHPQRALWYGEAIAGSPDDSETDYFYGYADCADAPDVALLLPKGWRMLESAVKPTPLNPAYAGPETEES